MFFRHIVELSIGSLDTYYMVSHWVQINLPFTSRLVPSTVVHPGIESKHFLEPE